MKIPGSKQIPPTKDAMKKLAEQLLENIGDGKIDLIWGPDLNLIEFSGQNGGEADMVDIQSSIRATAGKELSKELVEELKREDPVPADAALLIAKAKQNEDQIEEMEEDATS